MAQTLLLYNHAKRSFHTAFNSIRGKVGGVASEEVIAQLLKTKYPPVWPGHMSSGYRSLEFAVNSCFRKIFCVRSQTVAEECNTKCNCQPTSEMITRKYKFLNKYIYHDNEKCKLFNDRATVNLST